MEKKLEEKASQMRELQDRAEHRQREINRLRAQGEKRHDLRKKDMQDSS